MSAGVTPDMADLRAAIVNWLCILPHQHKARAWQMIDSFALHWYQTRTVAAHYRFAFPEEVVMAAQVFERLLRSITHATVDEELESLRYLRPVNIPRLQPIAADSQPLEDMLEIQSRKYQRIFRDFDHQQAVKEDYDRLNDKKRAAAVPECQDFPDDLESQHRLVEELFDAIVDFSAAEEKPRLLVRKTKKRKFSELEEDDNDDEARQWTENTYVKRIKSAKDVEIQFIAWNLLRKTMDAQNGLVGIGPWATNWKYNRFGSFVERFNSVKEVCRRSKAVVVSMMTADDIFTRRVAAGPAKEIGQKRQNKTTNSLRDLQNKAALHCQRKGWVLKDDNGRFIDAEGAPIAPSPPLQPTVETAETAEPIAEINSLATQDGLGQAAIHNDLVAYGGYSPASQSLSHVQQSSPAILTHVPGPGTLSSFSVTTPTSEDYYRDPRRAIAPAPTTDNPEQLGLSAERMNVRHEEAFVWRPCGGQHHVPQFDTYQEATNEDKQFCPRGSGFGITQ